MCTWRLYLSVMLSEIPSVTTTPLTAAQSISTFSSRRRDSCPEYWLLSPMPDFPSHRSRDYNSTLFTFTPCSLEVHICQVLFVIICVWPSLLPTLLTQVTFCLDLPLIFMFAGFWTLPVSYSHKFAGYNLQPFNKYIDFTQHLFPLLKSHSASWWHYPNAWHLFLYILSYLFLLFHNSTKNLSYRHEEIFLCIW